MVPNIAETQLKHSTFVIWAPFGGLLAPICVLGCVLGCVWGPLERSFEILAMVAQLSFSQGWREENQ